MHDFQDAGWRSPLRILVQTRITLLCMVTVRNEPMNHPGMNHVLVKAFAANVCTQILTQVGLFHLTKDWQS
jgi:hypothetical protein